MSPMNIVDYVVYDPATGAIVSWGRTQLVAVTEMLIQGRPWLVGEGTSDTHRVDLETKQIVPGTPDDPQGTLNLEMPE